MVITSCPPRGATPRGCVLFWEFVVVTNRSTSVVVCPTDWCATKRESPRDYRSRDGRDIAWRLVGQGSRPLTRFRLTTRTGAYFGAFIGFGDSRSGPTTRGSFPQVPPPLRPGPVLLNPCRVRERPIGAQLSASALVDCRGNRIQRRGAGKNVWCLRCRESSEEKTHRQKEQDRKSTGTGGERRHRRHRG